MKLENKITGDVLEVPMHDAERRGVILLNGEVIARLTYAADYEKHHSVFDSGERFETPEEFSAYVIEILRQRIPVMGHERNIGQA